MEAKTDVLRRTLNQLRLSKTNDKAQQDRLMNDLKNLAFKDLLCAIIAQTIRAYALLTLLTQTYKF